MPFPWKLGPDPSALCWSQNPPCLLTVAEVLARRSSCYVDECVRVGELAAMKNKVSMGFVNRLSIDLCQGRKDSVEQVHHHILLYPSCMMLAYMLGRALD